jgi:hypothetical protein
MVTVMHAATAAFVVCLFVAISPQRALSFNDEFDAVTTETSTEPMTTTTEMPELSTTTEEPDANSTIYYISRDDEQARRRQQQQQEGERMDFQNESIIAKNSVINIANATAAAIVDGPKAEARIKLKNHKRRKNSAISDAIKLASIQGFNAMIDLYDRREPEILRKGQLSTLKRDYECLIVNSSNKNLN